MVMSMLRISVARSDSFITACPVARRHHFSWGMACRGRQPSIPWAQQRVFAVRTPVLQNSCIWRTKSKDMSPLDNSNLHQQAIFTQLYRYNVDYKKINSNNKKSVTVQKILLDLSAIYCVSGANKTTYLLKTERSSSFLVCVTEVPLFLTLPLHVWCCFQHVAL